VVKEPHDIINSDTLTSVVNACHEYIDTHRRSTPTIANRCGCGRYHRYAPHVLWRSTCHARRSLNNLLLKRPSPPLPLRATIIVISVDSKNLNTCHFLTEVNTLFKAALKCYTRRFSGNRQLRTIWRFGIWKWHSREKLVSLESLGVLCSVPNGAAQKILADRRLNMFIFIRIRILKNIYRLQIKKFISRINTTIALLIKLI